MCCKACARACRGLHAPDCTWKLSQVLVSRVTGQVVLKSSMWITSGWPWTRAQPSNEQQLECAGLEKDRETGRCLTNGISLDCARSGDYFDHLDEPTGCTLISSALRGRGS